MAVGLRKNTKNEKKDSPMRIFGDLFGGRSLRKKLAKAEEAANYLATSKQKYVKKFSEAANYASGGIVGISHLTRSL